jgi:hypothetical protein
MGHYGRELVQHLEPSMLYQPLTLSYHCICEAELLLSTRPGYAQQLQQRHPPCSQQFTAYI